MPKPLSSPRARRRRCLLWGAIVAAVFTPSLAFAQSAPDPDPVDATPAPVSTTKSQFKPPNTPPPVPNPSPVVLRGRPTDEGTAGVPLVWQRKRFSTLDGVVTATGAAMTLASAIVRPLRAHTEGPVLFDSRVRNALRAPTLSKRYTFRDASDVGLSLAVTWPFFIDSLVTAWWAHGSRDVAEQMALVDLETFAVIGAIQGATNVLVSRERPFGDTCGSGLPTDAYDCTGSTKYRSFFSGHSAFSFTGAALVCFHHMEQELLGGPWDALSCVTAYGVAATTATFRVVSDVHFASDILMGAVMGTIVGYGVPLLHFKNPTAVKSKAGSLRLVPSGLGAGVTGMF